MEHDIAGRFALLLGLALVLITGSWAADTHRFLARSVPTTGEVIGIRVRLAQAGIEFMTRVRVEPTKAHRPDTCEVTLAESSVRPRYGLGEKAPVLYDRDNPCDLLEDSQMTLWWPIVYCGIFSMGLLFLGLSSVAVMREGRVWCGRIASVFLLSFPVGAAFLILTNCGAESRAESAVAARRQRCRADAECPGTFCDRGLCAPPLGDSSSSYGSECEERSAAGEARGGAVSVCWPFVCMKNRCRSCATDSECSKESFGRSSGCYGPHWGMSACTPIPDSM